jgi:hypothetical protein
VAKSNSSGDASRPLKSDFRLSSLTRRLDDIERLAADPRQASRFARYQSDPAAYAQKILGVSWWAKQREIAESLLTPPYRTLVKASHSVGKSFVSSCLVSWVFDTRPQSITITTAPRYDQVKDVLWKEIRLQRRRARLGGFVGPKMPRLETAPDHYAVGTTAARAEGLQGQHGIAVFAFIDEAVGVDPEIWRAIDSMAQGVEFGVLAICNPTDTTSEFYRREQQHDIPWHVISISCLEHPNIAAELRGDTAPFPAAVRLAWVDERIREWCEPVAGEVVPTDILWPSIGGLAVEASPVGASRWWRPGPEAESRLLGRWPSQTYGVWNDALWGQIESLILEPPADELPVIGADIARYGDDDSAAHVRCGPVSIHHEYWSGAPIDHSAGRLVQLAEEYAVWATTRQAGNGLPVAAQNIPIRVDDDGVGGGVTDILRAAGYNVQPIIAQSTAKRPDRYKNVRSELWFDAVSRARDRRLSLARLSAKVRHRLKIEAMAPKYKLDAEGRRVVDPKEETKKPDKLGRSPDSLDAMNLAYYEPGGQGGAEPVTIESAGWTETRGVRGSGDRPTRWGRR